MSERDRQSDGTFGFARGTQSGAAKGAASVRLVYSDERKMPADPVDSPPPAGIDETPPAPAERSSHWVVKPKAGRPLEAAPEPAMPTMAPRRRTAPVHASGTTPTMPMSVRGPDQESRRWLALGLAGMVYVVGITGLWSMVRAFDETGAAPLTPAVGEKALPLPPIDEAIDIRDAQLDGPFVPTFKPDLTIENDQDVAGSGLQKRS